MEKLVLYRWYQPVQNQLIVVFQYTSFTVFFLFVLLLVVIQCKYGTIHSKFRQNPRLKIFHYRFWSEGEYRFSLKALNPQKTKKWTWSLPGKNALRSHHARSIKNTARSRALWNSWRSVDSKWSLIDLWPDICISQESESSWRMAMNHHRILVK